MVVGRCLDPVYHPVAPPLRTFQGQRSQKSSAETQEQQQPKRKQRYHGQFLPAGTPRDPQAGTAMSEPTDGRTALST